MNCDFVHNKYGVSNQPKWGEKKFTLITTWNIGSFEKICKKKKKSFVSGISFLSGLIDSSLTLVSNIIRAQTFLQYSL